MFLWALTVSWGSGGFCSVHIVGDARSGATFCVRLAVRQPCAAAARAGDDPGRRGVQHPDRGRGEDAGRARPRGRAAGLGRGGAGAVGAFADPGDRRGHLLGPGGGLLHEPESPADLAAKLYQMMTDRETADRCALGGQEMVRKRFNDATMARAIAEAYERHLSK